MNYKTITNYERLAKKQSEILMILAKAKVNNEDYATTLEKIIKVSVQEYQSEN